MPLSTESVKYAVSLIKQSSGLLVSTRNGFSKLASEGLDINPVPLPGSSLSIASLQTFKAELPAPNIAYFIRTSGTTSTLGLGTPVAVPHASFFNNLLAISARLSLDRPIIPLLSPLTFDPSLIELFLPLVCGGTVVILPRDRIVAPSRLFPLVSECTALFCTPSLFRRFTSADRASILSGNTGIETMVLGGEPFPLDSIGAAGGPKINIYNIYGTTENSIWATLWKYDGGEHALLGEPLGETLVEFLPSEEERLFEIMLGGKSRVTYLPGESAEEPVLKRRTGDLVRKLDAGFEIIGRASDAQTKVRGRRVNLHEISGVIRSLGYRDCEVVCLPTEQIAAFLPGPTADLATLQRGIRERLPAHAVPTLYQIDKLPVTLNGKVDRKKLVALADELQPARSWSFEPEAWTREAVHTATLNLVFSVLGIADDSGSDRLRDGKFYFLAQGGTSFTAALVVEALLDLAGLSKDAEKKDTMRSKLLNKLVHGTVAEVAGLVSELRGSTVLGEVAATSAHEPPAPSITSPAESVSRKRKRISNERSFGWDSVPSAPCSTWTELWTVDLEACVDASPLVLLDSEEGTVFIGSHAGIFSAVALEGTVRWTTRIPGRIEGTACAVGDLVCFGCYDHHIYFLSIDSGAIQWTFETGEIVKCSPVAVGGDVVVGSHDGHLYRLDPGRKRMVWKAGVGKVFGRPAILGDLVIVGTLEGRVAALDAETGQTNWMADVGKPVFAGIVAGDSAIFVATVGGSLICFGQQDGKERWRYTVDAPIFSSPVLEPNTDLVVFGTHARSIVALSATTGNHRWMVQTETPVYASVTILDTTVIAASTDARVRLLNLHDGALLESFVGCQAEMYSSPVPLDRRTMVLAGRDDKLRLVRRGLS